MNSIPHGQNTQEQDKYKMGSKEMSCEHGILANMPTPCPVGT
jgi:hypothetical protein